MRGRTLEFVYCCSKLTKGENVSTAVLLKICEALQCDISEIAETVEATNKK